MIPFDEGQTMPWRGVPLRLTKGVSTCPIAVPLFAEIAQRGLGARSSSSLLLAKLLLSF
jgi:hypothetical protein